MRSVAGDEEALGGGCAAAKREAGAAADGDARVGRGFLDGDAASDFRAVDGDGAGGAGGASGDEDVVIGSGQGARGSYVASLGGCPVGVRSPSARGGPGTGGVSVGIPIDGTGMGGLAEGEADGCGEDEVAEQWIAMGWFHGRWLVFCRLGRWIERMRVQICQVGVSVRGLVVFGDGLFHRGWAVK